MKKKLIILLPLLLVVAGGAYKFVLAPKPMVKPPKIAGAVVPLQKDFLINLDGGRYAKVAVAVIMKDPAGAAHGATDGGLPQEAAVRAIITDTLTGVHAEELIEPKARKEVLHHILEAIEKKTDEHVVQVLFTDITVQ
jgi:flagellar FliL protein